MGVAGLTVQDFGRRAIVGAPAVRPPLPLLLPRQLVREQLLGLGIDRSSPQTTFSTLLPTLVSRFEFCSPTLAHRPWQKLLRPTLPPWLLKLDSRAAHHCTTPRVTSTHAPSRLSSRKRLATSAAHSHESTQMLVGSRHL